MHVDSADASASTESTTFSRNEVFKRIEEDRERHKRLRERRWVQPIAHNNSASHAILASFAPDTALDGGGAPESELSLDIEFDNEWETTSDWNEDDDEAVAEENLLCYPNVGTRLGLLDEKAVATALPSVPTSGTEPTLTTNRPHRRVIIRRSLG